MAATSVRRRAVRVAARAPARALTPAEAAWVAALPCALLLVAAIVLLGRPLGHVLFPIPKNTFWPSIAGQVWPEPTEHAAYLLALVAPFALSGLVLANGLMSLRLGVPARRALVLASQVAVLVFAVVCVVQQHRIWFGPVYTLGRPAHRAYFTWASTGVAVAFALLACLALASERARARGLALLRETRGRRIAAASAALVFVAIWLLTAINLDSSVGNVNRAVYDMLPWSMDETFAILDGRTPLVSFHPQYAQLWPYLVAGGMSVLGTSLAAYTLLMSALSAGALLSVYAVLRRIARSSLAALGLFLPFVATGFFMERGPLANRYGPSNLLTIFPVRYAGPYVLAWLLARRLDGAAPRRAWPIFLLAGLVAINNVEFGAAAVGATLAACVWAQPPGTVRAAGRLAGEAAAGILGAILLVTLVTLARSGSLPHFGLMFEFSKLYGLTGWAMLPMPHVGFHLVIYLTFAGALVLATVRAASRDEDVTLTGMLAWSGIFGLGIGAYYAGRSHPEVLINLFSAWMLALVLLVLVAVRAIAARPSRRPTAVELAVLAGFGLAICTLAQTPTPWGQIERIEHATRGVQPYLHNTIERFVARQTRRGEHVVILAPVGHRIAYDLGITNVSPYTSSEAVNTPAQLATTLRALRAAHGTRVFVWYPDTPQEIFRSLQVNGFRNTRNDQRSSTLEFDAASGG